MLSLCVNYEPVTFQRSVENFAHLKGKYADDVFEKTRGEVMDLLRKTVRPEFLNRVDEVIMFEPLGRKDPAERDKSCARSWCCT